MSASTVEGTDAGDWINGTNGDDVIEAGDGLDVLQFVGGNVADTFTMITFKAFQ